jgi:hypothetical protein
MQPYFHVFSPPLSLYSCRQLRQLQPLRTLNSLKIVLLSSFHQSSQLLWCSSHETIPIFVGTEVSGLIGD